MSVRALERLALRVLTHADAACNRMYSWRFNPLYQSGTIVVALYLALLATGLWLILFYRVGAPWESVAGLTSNLWLGRWVRGLHRFASDAAVVATAVHAFRMFAQGRSWGARTLAWVSGGLLLFLLLICGWTGYVMVWDSFGEYLAREGSRLIDALPVLSEPTSRTFTGERPVPSAFFFITLFAHVGVPLGMGVVFWIHIKRLARPALLPSRPLMWTTIGALTAIAFVRPVVMAPQANPFVLPAEIPTDVFFAFWMPLTRGLDGRVALVSAIGAAVALLLVPLVTTRRGAAAPGPSNVDGEICVGCEQCSIDCPYGAIEMVPRTSVRSALVAQVDSALCVSCGICAGSCPPMGVGPAGRTGRDQIEQVHAFLGADERRAGEIVAVCCDHGAGEFSDALMREGAAIYRVSCAGNLHTSVVELLLRGGAGGVLVMACPPRDCWNREGARWLDERMYHDREAELQARVDRARVRIAYANAREWTKAVAALRIFSTQVAVFDKPITEVGVTPDTQCGSGEPAVRA